MAKAGLPPKGASSVPAPGADNASKLNPNMWRVYALTPPRNPFVQQESWYAETFQRMIPGYPQLEEYFNSESDVLPNLNHLFGEKIDFAKVDLARNHRDQVYVLKGTSDDGKTDTTVTATEVKPADIELTFDRNGHVVDRNLPLGNDGLPPAGGSPGDAPGRLPVPGGPGSAMEGSGDSLGCTGISIHDGHASALMTLNGSSYLVHEGGALPPRYSNVHITPNGVELKDTETGKKQFVQLKAPDKEEDLPAVMRGRRMVTQS
jgi:hypothetical protein